MIASAKAPGAGWLPAASTRVCWLVLEIDMTRWGWTMGWMVCAAVCGGCGGSTPPPDTAGDAPAGDVPPVEGTPETTPEATGPSASSAAPATSEEQIALGAKLYAANCAGCHGEGGEGSKGAPAVVGKGALPLDAQPPSKARNVKFHTAADVFAFVKSTMPPQKPGSLTDEEYAAIMAFDLKANGVDLGGKILDPSNAASFVLHP